MKLNTHILPRKSFYTPVPIKSFADGKLYCNNCALHGVPRIVDCYRATTFEVMSNLKMCLGVQWRADCYQDPAFEVTTNLKMRSGASQIFDCD